LNILCNNEGKTSVHLSRNLCSLRIAAALKTINAAYKERKEQ